MPNLLEFYSSLGILFPIEIQEKFVSTISFVNLFSVYFAFEEEWTKTHGSGKCKNKIRNISLKKKYSIANLFWKNAFNYRFHTLIKNVISNEGFEYLFFSVIENNTGEEIFRVALEYNSIEYMYESKYSSAEFFALLRTLNQKNNKPNYAEFYVATSHGLQLISWNIYDSFQYVALFTNLKLSQVHKNFHKFYLGSYDKTIPNKILNTDKFFNTFLKRFRSWWYFEIIDPSDLTIPLTIRHPLVKFVSIVTGLE